MRIIAVPWRYIDSELEPFCRTGIREFLQHITLAVFPRTVGHCVGALRVRPETEPVVMFRHNYQPLESGRLGDRDPLFTIKIRGIENILGFRPEPPLHPGESVRPEADKEVHFHLLPFDLLG